jgi:SAM-dependent methyltransferase
MHPQFLELLCCPKTGELLALEAAEYGDIGMIRTGVLRTRSGNAYPVVRGIPRFVDAEQYATSFGFEWTRWPKVQFESENVGRPMAGWTTRMWERITNANEDAVRDRTVVEFGCGPGRFLDVVRRKGGKAVGIDLSLAVEAARKNFADDPGVLVVQGDLLHPPFRKGVFDGGYSIGVLHHTPDPAAGLLQLGRTVRSSGWVACCVYPKDGLYDYHSTARLRRVHAGLKTRFGYRPALAYSFFSAYALTPFFRVGRRIPVLRRFLDFLEKNWLVVLYLRDGRWRFLDTFDAITPSIASTHTAEEVQTWMMQAGCKNIVHTDWGSTSFCGTRKANV